MEKGGKSEKNVHLVVSATRHRFRSNSRMEWMECFISPVVASIALASSLIRALKSVTPLERGSGEQGRKINEYIQMRYELLLFYHYFYYECEMGE